MIFEKMVNRTIIQSRYKISIDLAAGRVPSFHQLEMMMTMIIMTMTLNRMMMERRLPTQNDNNKNMIFEKMVNCTTIRSRFKISIDLAAALECPLLPHHITFIRPDPLVTTIFVRNDIIDN